MFNSGKKNSCDKKKFLNEKTHSPPLQVKWSVPNKLMLANNTPFHIKT